MRGNRLRLVRREARGELLERRDAMRPDLTLPCGCQPTHGRCEVAAALYERWFLTGWASVLERFRQHYNEGWAALRAA